MQLLKILYLSMRWRPYKYLSPLLIMGCAWVAFHQSGWLSFMPLLYTFVLIPLLELFFPPDTANLADAEEEMAKADRTYDVILYLMVPLHYFLLYTFLHSVNTASDDWTLAGRITGMGILCGVFGINVAHELGHRTTRYERFMAKALLLTSLYMHFYIEHNKGHHKRVATPEDPASARFRENIFRFYLRSIVCSYLSAWQISRREMQQKKRSFWHPSNEILQYHIIQPLFVGLIYYLFVQKATLAFLLSAAMGICLLEAVNYIEHYGLSRKKIDGNKYERPLPVHSWNSNHILGRITLFELSRHSDHHYKASRKYQVLRHHPEAPQMPIGYPGMMVLAHIPPLWFRIMHKRMEALQQNPPASIS